MRRLAILLAAFLPGAAPALAHPHVLIDAHVVFQFEKGKVTSLLVGWKFDPVYSASLVGDYDSNKDGKFDAKELGAIEKEAFSGTAEQGYFTYVSQDGKPVKGLKATRFTVIAVKDSLVYSFVLPLPKPVDPVVTRLSVTTYEETYYIDIDYPNDKAARLNGEGHEACRPVIGPDKANPILGGAVIPKKVDIVCG